MGTEEVANTNATGSVPTKAESADLPLKRRHAAVNDEFRA